MDSTRFIRRKQILAIWVGLPLILASLIYMTAHSFMERQKITFSQAQTLEQVIPQMSHANEAFNRFIIPYIATTNARRSIEDEKIQLLNQAAEESEVIVSSINLAQGVLDETIGAIRIGMHVTATGTDRGLARFLNNVRLRDPFIFEDQVMISRDGRDGSGFQIEAVLSKICIDDPQGGLE